MRKVYTTGEAAKFLQVAPRTVSKWFDQGRLRGYRIPGSQDRRIPQEQLIRFMRDNGMPVPEELTSNDD
jgi:two-component system response regulator RpaA